MEKSDRTERDVFRVISDQLTEGFILREYADRFGIFDIQFEEKAVEKYRNDPIFRARVCGVVSSVMGIITKNIDI